MKCAYTRIVSNERSRCNLTNAYRMARDTRAAQKEKAPHTLTNNRR